MAKSPHHTQLQKIIGNATLGIITGILGLIILLIIIGADLNNKTGLGKTALIIWVVMLALALMLLLRGIMGIRTLKLTGRFKKLQPILAAETRIPFSQLEQLWQKPLKRVLSDLYQLIDWQLLSTTHVDLGQRELLSETATPAETEHSSILEAQPVKSLTPLLLPLATVLLYALLFPWQRVAGLVALILMLIPVFRTARKHSAARWRFTERELRIDTGNDALNSFLQAALQHRNELKSLRQEINNPKIKKDIGTLLDTAQEIFNFIEQNPQRIRQLKQFMDYYLPMTIKLLNDYAEMENHTEKGEVMHQSMVKIEDFMDTVILACRNELDSLFSNKAIDISSDIAVMKQMIPLKELDEILEH